MSKLLIDDYPIQVLPKLAEEIGLNEAIFLQQLHYWLNSKDAKVVEGRKWVYNTYEEWQRQFPFWSMATIKRILTSLNKQQLIIKANYNRAGFDKTVWYSINYLYIEQMSQRLGQNDPTRGSTCTNGEGQSDPTNTIDYTETTTENKKKTRKSRKRTYEDDSIYMILANTLFQQICQNQEIKQPNIQNWADDIRKMIEIDKRTEDQVRRMIHWSQQNAFWSANILSANKLRAKYDTMAAQANRDLKKSSNQRSKRIEALPDHIVHPPKETISIEQEEKIDEMFGKYLDFSEKGATQ